MLGKFKNLLDKIPTGLLSAFMLGLILWFTLAPNPTGNITIPLFPGADKIVHGIMFGIFTLVMLLECMKHRKWTDIPMAGIGVIAFMGAGLGIVTELLQRAMGLGRTLEIYDMLADGAGAMIAGAVWWIFQDFLQNPE